MMLVEALRPRSSSALRNCAKLLSAFLMPASEVVPLRPDDGVEAVAGVTLVVGSTTLVAT
jgi:hypothetical protein